MPDEAELSAADALIGRVFATPSGAEAVLHLCPACVERVRASIERCRAYWGDGAPIG